MTTSSAAMHKMWKAVSIIFLYSLAFFGIISILAIIGYYLNLSSTTKIRGVVTNGMTGEPLKNAKVIVSYNWGYQLSLSNGPRVGIYTDANGEFELNHTFDFFVKKPRIEASWTNNYYFHSWTHPSQSEQIWTIELMPIPFSQKDDEWLFYDDFSGSSNLDVGWLNTPYN